MLRPDGGQILLGGDDITALGPEERVRRGLVRTFQINTPVPASHPARGGDARDLRARGDRRAPGGGRLPAYRDAVDEAYAILELAAARRRSATARRASSPTASSGCSRSRWRSRPGRRCCCSTSRRPACRARKAPSCSPRSPACRRTSRCCSSSTTWTWCSGFASRIIVMVGGRILLEGTPDEISADPRVREVYLGGAAPWLSRCSPSRTCAPATARPWCSTTSRFEIAGARQPRGAGPQRRRQVARCCSRIMGFTQLTPRRDRLARHATSRGWRRTAARGPASAGSRRSARFSLADGRGEPHRRRRGRAAGTSSAVLRAVPAAEGAARQPRATSSPAASSRCWRSRAR